MMPIRFGPGICAPCRSPGAHWYEPHEEFRGVLGGIWLCDSCVAPEIVQKRYYDDQEAASLMRGICPHSGLPLRVESAAWGRPALMCYVCDCFGFGSDDSRLPADLREKLPPAESLYPPPAGDQTPS